MPENKKYIDITKGDDIHQRALTYPDSQADDELNMTHSDYDVTPTISGPAWKVATKDAAWENDMNLDNPIRSVGVEGIGDSTYDQAIQSEEDLKDLNEVRAREQWGLTKLAGGLGKFGVETVNTTVGNIVGTVVGIYQGIYNSFDENPNTTFWNGLWNNGITEVQNSIREWQENAMPTYRSRAEQNMSPIRSIFTASGFADLMAQAGFTSGMLLSTWLTGGMGAGSGAASLLKMAGASKKTVNFAYRLISGIMGSVSEASMEGLNNYNDSKEHYMEKLREQYNVQKSQIEQQMQDELKSALIQANPTLLTDNPIRDIEQENAIKQSIYEKYASQIASLDQQFVLDSQNIENRALSVGSMTFGLNMAILGLSNTLGTLSFLKAPSQNAERQISKGLAQRTKEFFTGVSKDRPYGKGISKAEARATGVREGLAEGFEESNQKWASNLAAQYYGSDYDPDATDKFSRFLETSSETFKTTYSDPETWKEWFMGAITGLSGTFNPAGVAKALTGEKTSLSDYWQGGLIEAWREGGKLSERSQKAYDEMNNFATNKKLQDNFRLGVFNLASKQRQMEAAARGDKLEYENENDAQTLRMIQTFANAGRLNELKALVGDNENMSDDELNALCEGLTQKGEDGKYTSDYSFLLTENGERISDILDKDDPRRQEAKDKIANETKRINKMVNTYLDAINTADSRTGYTLSNDELNLHAWGAVQAERADSRIKDIIEKRLDTFKLLTPRASKLSELASKNVDKIIKNLQSELNRESKKKESDERNKNISDLNEAIESLNNFKNSKTEEHEETTNIFDELLKNDNPSTVGMFLNTKVDDNNYIADALLESLADSGLLTDEIQRDVVDATRLYNARRNYDQLVNSWAKNPQGLTDFLKREARLITSNQIRQKAEKFNEAYKRAKVKSVDDFKAKVDKIAKAAGITSEDEYYAVTEKAAQTNKDLVLFGNSIVYQNRLKSKINEIKGADDNIKEFATELLSGKNFLYQQIRYSTKAQIARMLKKGFGKLSKSEQEALEKAASLIYFAKESMKNDESNVNKTSAQNEDVKSETIDDNEEQKESNNSETPTAEPANNSIPEKWHDNQEILKGEFAEAGYTNAELDATYSDLVVEIEQIKKELEKRDYAKDGEEVSKYINKLIGNYVTALVCTSKDGSFYEVANTCKQAISDFCDKTNLPLAFTYDNVSTNDEEVKQTYSTTSSSSAVSVDFAESKDAPEGLSMIVGVTVDYVNGKYSMNINVLRGPAIVNEEVAPKQSSPAQPEISQEVENEIEETSDNTNEDTDEQQQSQEEESSKMFDATDKDVVYDEMSKNLVDAEPVSEQQNIEDSEPVEEQTDSSNENVVEAETSEPAITQEEESVTQQTETQSELSEAQPQTPTNGQNETPKTSNAVNRYKYDEYGNKIVQVKRPEVGASFGGKNQNAIVWSDGFKYYSDANGNVDFTKESTFDDAVLTEIRESDTFNYINSGKLRKFLKDNPNAPLYVKPLPVKINGKNPTRTDYYVFGLYVKDGDKYVFVGYKVRPYSSKQRPDYALINNMYDAIYGFEQHYKEAYYNSDDLITTASNIEFVASKNEDGYYSFTNKDGKVFKINKICPTPIPQTPTKRRDTSDVNVGNKSIKEAYADGDIYLAINSGKGKTVEAVGSKGTVSVRSELTNTGGVIVLMNGSNSEYAQAGIVGKRITEDLIDRNSDNKIISGIVSEVDKIQKALNDDSSLQTIQALITRGRLSHLMFTKNWKVSKTNNGFAISIERDGRLLSSTLRTDSKFEDIIKAFIDLKAIFSVDISDKTTLTDFLGLSETIITNFESPAKLLIGFVNDPIDEHTMNINEINTKKGSLVNIGDTAIRMFDENGKFVCEPVDTNTKKSVKDIAGLLGINYTKENVGSVETTVNTILLDIQNGFSGRNILEIETMSGDIVRCVYYKKTDNVIETLFDVDSNQCVDLSSDKVLRANLRALEAESSEINTPNTANDVSATPVVSVVDTAKKERRRRTKKEKNETKTTDGFVETTKEEIAQPTETVTTEVEVVTPTPVSEQSTEAEQSELNNQTPNEQPKETDFKTSREKTNIARRQDRGENVNKRGRGLKFSVGEEYYSIPDGFYDEMADEQQDISKIYSFGNADILKGMFGGNDRISTKEALGKIAESKDKNISALAKMLSEKIGELGDLTINLRVGIRDEHSHALMNNTKGAYHPLSNTISVNVLAVKSPEGLSQTIMHEILHAIVLNTKKNKEDWEKLAVIFESTKQQILGKYGYNSYEDIQNQHESNALYGLKNIDEFISEIFTNRQFRVAVDNDSSFITKFINWLKGLFKTPSEIAMSEIKKVLFDKFDGNTLQTYDRTDASSLFNEEDLKRIKERSRVLSSNRISAIQFAQTIIQEAKDSGELNKLIEKVQSVGSEETRNNVVDFIRYANNLHKGGLYNRIRREMYHILASTPTGKLYLAPNGKPSNLSKQQWTLVRTKAFKDWFGDWESNPESASKVVDENGEPLVVYHGTRNKFTTFDKEKIGSKRPSYHGRGFYFTPSINYAKGYSGFNEPLAAFLNIKNPNIYKGDYKEKENTDGNWVLDTSVNSDGIKDHMDEIVVFNPNQIKSATDNVGTFSSRNNDITDNINSMTDSELLETYYDVVFGNVLDAEMKDIESFIEMCKDPDFITMLQKNSSPEKNSTTNDVNSENNANFASVLDNKNNKCK